MNRARCLDSMAIQNLQMFLGWWSMVKPPIWSSIGSQLGPKRHKRRKRLVVWPCGHGNSINCCQQSRPSFTFVGFIPRSGVYRGLPRNISSAAWFPSSPQEELVVEIESLRERQDEGSIGLSELAETFHRLDAWCLRGSDKRGL